MTPVVKIIDRGGLEEYSDTLSLQTQLLEQKIHDRDLPEMLVLVEHEPVYTVGRSEQFQQIANSKASNVKWLEVGRGGKATFHGPGQLVAYPIFDLHHQGRDVHVFLRKLEEALIHCLGQFQFEAYTREGLTGVWVKNSFGQEKKIASIGIGVRKWVSYHGVALNVTTDLDYFKSISPCAQDGSVMTSLEELCEEKGIAVPQMENVKAAFVGGLLRSLNLRRDEDFGDAKAEVYEPSSDSTLVRPPWLKVKAPGSPEYNETREVVKRLRLTTVCEEAHCPNIGECWTHHTATFMIMGELCTRRCGFCSVKDGWKENLEPLDPMEPVRVAYAISELGLKHVVITSVDRDDLPDMGAGHFDRTVRAIKKKNPDCAVELLIPDMRGRRKWVEAIVASGQVSVLNHNVETVPRIYRHVRPGAKFQRSLDVLKWAKLSQPHMKTKSGLMVGLGETFDEVLEVMDALREHGVEILTIGQYLQPTQKQLPVERFVTPEEFAAFKTEGQKRGFSFVESGPLVRSSYHAWKHVDNDEVEAQKLSAQSV